MLLVMFRLKQTNACWKLCTCESVQFMAIFNALFTIIWHTHSQKSLGHNLLIQTFCYLESINRQQIWIFFFLVLMVKVHRQAIKVTDEDVDRKHWVQTRI